MTGSTPRIVFCFAGQGYVPLEAARDLFRTCSAFKNAIFEVDEEIQSAVERKCLQRTFIPLSEYLSESTTRPAYVPPFGEEESNEGCNGASLTTPSAPLVIFASQYALARTLQSMDINPTDIVGYSLGEHCASMVTGSLPLEAGLKLLLRREGLFADRSLIPNEGGMMTVQSPPQEVATFLAEKGLSGAADISGYPHPGTTVLSGEAAALDDIHESMSFHGIDAQRRGIKFGMHASHVSGVACELRHKPSIFPDSASKDAVVRPGVAHWSNITGTQLPPGTPLNANYWATHLTTPIHFKQCIEGIYQKYRGNEVMFLDLGMGPRLTRLVQNTLDKTKEWESGKMRAVGCVTRTEEKEEGWAMDALRKNLDGLVKV